MAGALGTWSDDVPDATLRDDVETLIRSWEAHERARGARPVIDYDFAPTDAAVRPSSSRLGVYQRLLDLRARAQTAGAARILEVLRAHAAYLGHLLGERPALEQYSVTPRAVVRSAGPRTT